eukprot:5408242-Amphidinium_carterae.1
MDTLAPVQKPTLNPPGFYYNSVHQGEVSSAIVTNRINRPKRGETDQEAEIKSRWQMNRFGNTTDLTQIHTEMDLDNSSTLPE